MKRKSKTGFKKAGLLPPREDWDFESCPAGREKHCFYYEYARESPWIIDEFHLAQRCSRKVKFGWQCGFDDYGNWHFWSFGDSEQHDDWGIVLQVPPGFPSVPYLNTTHHVVEPRGVGGTIEPHFNESEEWKKQGFSDEGPWSRIRINWDSPDKALVKEFKKWLERNRPRPAHERRGNPTGRRYRADLKALGAYRLMVKAGMTAEEAQIYTKQFMPHGLYAKIPDWYEGKSRALLNLEEIFRYEQESIAAMILADGACNSCPMKGDDCGSK